MEPESNQGKISGPTRREVLLGALSTGLAWSVGQSAVAAVSPTQADASDLSLNPGQKAILAELMAGNERYVSGKMRKHDLAHAREGLTIGQQPNSAVIRCADSRVAPELVFDQSLGEIFVCGVAGNIPTPEIMASLEYAISNLGTGLILIMGHSSCGAVDAALKNQNQIDSLPGNLPGLLSQILPSVLEAQKLPGDKLANSIAQNAMNAAARLTKMSTVVEKAVSNGTVGIASGVYDLSSGRFKVNGPG